MQKKDSIKKYQLSLSRKFGVVVENSDLLNISLTGYLKTIKFQIIDSFIINLILMNINKNDENSEFIHNLDLDANTENSLREYLIKHKRDVVDYIISEGELVNTNLYEFYLHYVPYELNEIEKNLFLDGYINMITDSHGTEVSFQKRKKLENILSINQD